MCFLVLQIDFDQPQNETASGIVRPHHSERSSWLALTLITQTLWASIAVCVFLACPSSLGYNTSRRA